MIVDRPPSLPPAQRGGARACRIGQRGAELLLCGARAVHLEHHATAASERVLPAQPPMRGVGHRRRRLLRRRRRLRLLRVVLLPRRRDNRRALLQVRSELVLTHQARLVVLAARRVHEQGVGRRRLCHCRAAAAARADRPHVRAEEQRAKTARHEQPRQQRCDERGDGERDEEPECEPGVVPAEHATHGAQLEDVAAEHDLHPAEVRLQE
mmetsp:Transcript_48795/g.117561  ORF Transcript_48795/g.117561 Transcript_48795/m.117561 type:complete len:210 (+) Transcript_48795:142-771(+)